MMNIWEMRMRVRDWCMPVWMHMRLLTVPFEIVFVLMMFVMTVPVVMLQHLVRMRMVVPLADMQPDAEGHQRRGDPEQQRR